MGNETEEADAYSLIANLFVKRNPEAAAVNLTEETKEQVPTKTAPVEETKTPAGPETSTAKAGKEQKVDPSKEAEHEAIIAKVVEMTARTIRMLDSSHFNTMIDSSKKQLLEYGIPARRVE